MAHSPLAPMRPGNGKWGPLQVPLLYHLAGETMGQSRWADFQ